MICLYNGELVAPVAPEIVKLKVRGLRLGEGTVLRHARRLSVLSTLSRVAFALKVTMSGVNPLPPAYVPITTPP